MPLSMQQQATVRQEQRLIMTPQMQQSIKLLQLNTLELETLAQQEMLENPFLELEEEERDLEAEEREIASDGEQEVEVVREKESEADGEDSDSDGKETVDSDGADEEFDAATVEEQPEQFEEVDTDWAEVFEASELRNYSMSGGEPQDDRSYEETVPGRKSLYEKLHWQLGVSALEGLDLKIGEYIVGCIDENGYLQASVEEIAEHFDLPVEKVEEVLVVVQDFEPTGIAARDLPECLCLQLRALGGLTEVRERILREHWAHLSRKKFREIARDLECSEQEVQDLFNRVKHLDPSPGREYTKEQAFYVTPDVYVRKMDGKYVTYLNEGEVAHLHLNREYKNILLDDSKDQDPKIREYALEKYRAAAMFIKNVERRRNTVLRVTEAIMEYQHEFLEKGVEALRPLALSEIAERVELHESTVSRVTSNKYVDTPQGMFLLKYFFSSAIESQGGDATSSRSIKQKIQEMIDNEDPKKPLSDDKVAKALKAEGFSIARRTVAKYREQMKILPTNLRKQVK